ncbi:hypothetical protein AWC25_23165 [Mycobacterium sherrisii]|uniref:Uncharacterized protein n=1 Tax=Mycobacterium sherrisii TaxID=243061 RepID=A0A1E3SAD6_9MYCO|nr:hypothetical protein BHQ21_25510 [Mycobacterium sherrisii]ORW85459.1 hypothetical protein AWC25_23165 [Mycobacterium sherrisii]
MTATGTGAAKTAAPSSVAPLAADLDVALRRLKLATVRRNAAEVLQVAKTQRWTPEEILRTLVEAEIAARDSPSRWSPPTGTRKASRARASGPATRWSSRSKFSAPNPSSAIATWRSWYSKRHKGFR